MVPHFFDLLLERSAVILPLSVVLFLLSAIVILIFHRLIHGQASPGKKAVTIASLFVGMLLASSSVGGLLGNLAIVTALLAGWRIRPGQGKRILLFALIPSAFAWGIWIVSSWDDASRKYDMLQHFAKEDARYETETADFLKREYLTSASRDEGIAFDNGEEITMDNLRFLLPIPSGFRYQFWPYRWSKEPRWALRFDNPANGDFFAILFGPMEPSEHHDIISEAERRGFFNRFLWRPKEFYYSTLYEPVPDPVLEQNSPAVIIAVLYPAQKNRTRIENVPKRAIGACLAARGRDILLEIRYAPDAVDFDLSLPVTWLNRFAEINGGAAVPPPLHSEKSALLVLDPTCPSRESPMDERMVDPTKPEWFFTEAPDGPAPSFKWVDAERFLTGGATIPIPAGWEEKIDPAVSDEPAGVFFADGNTFFNINMVYAAQGMNNSPVAILDAMRQRGFTPGHREKDLDILEQELVSLGDKLERLAPDRMARNTAGSVLVMRPAKFKKSPAGTAEGSVGSIFIASFLLGGRLVYGCGSIASVDGKDASYLVSVWLDAFMERNHNEEELGRR